MKKFKQETTEEVNHHRTKKNLPSINKGILINSIIILSLVLIISICYMIGGFLANPLVVIGIIVLYALISLYNHFSILEKQNERILKNTKIHEEEVRN